MVQSKIKWLPFTETIETKRKKQIKFIQIAAGNSKPSTRIYTQMGSEQSHPAHGTSSRSVHGRPNTATGAGVNGARLQRGTTIAVTERRISTPQDETRSTATYPDSRPVSPPISVCSDSDMPYVSYTDKPIGGKCTPTRWRNHRD